MLVFITSNFDQVGGLFKIGHHVRHVFKSFKPRANEFRSYLLSKKQFGLDSILGCGFVHGFLKIKVLQSFAHSWKGAIALRKSMENFNIGESIFEKLMIIGFFLWLILTWPFLS